MAKAYVIIRGWGEYSDRGTTPAKVYLDRAKAEAAMAALDTVYRRFVAAREQIAGKSGYFEKVKAMIPESAAAYAALGFEADLNDDWELAEADLDGV